MTRNTWLKANKIVAAIDQMELRLVMVQKGIRIQASADDLGDDLDLSAIQAQAVTNIEAKIQTAKDAFKAL